MYALIMEDFTTVMTEVIAAGDLQSAENGMLHIIDMETCEELKIDGTWGTIKLYSAT